MLLFGFQKSERSRIEACVGLLLGLIVLAFPLEWWIKTVLVFVIAVISVHLIFDSPMTIRLSTRSKVGISLVAIAIFASITWSQLHGRYLNDRVGNLEQPKQAVANSIIAKLNKVPAPISGSAKSDENLRSDTADLVKQLRDFQLKVDDWHKTGTNKLNEDIKNEESKGQAHEIYIEHAKELGAAIADLNKQFNGELKPRIIAIKNRLTDRLPPASVPANPTVDYTLNYGFSTFPNAVGSIADYLENLSAKLPEK